MFDMIDQFLSANKNNVLFRWTPKQTLDAFLHFLADRPEAHAELTMRNEAHKQAHAEYNHKGHADLKNCE